MKRALVIGSGGREHAIVEALYRSPQVAEIFCAPGNAGTAAHAQNIDIKDTDVSALLSFAQEQQIDLTVVGPESALAAGIVDAFRTAGMTIFGHTADATRIESSKEFAKKLMLKYGIPTADYQTFTDYREAKAYTDLQTLPVVLKYDGLAAGKGVVVAESREEVDEALHSMLVDNHFGAGKVIIEEYLTGPEFSFMCFVDGERVYPMPLAQDHKRAFDGDKGPNTGGMGAYTPVPFVTEADRECAYRKIMEAAAKAMKQEGFPLTGVLYGGLMKTPNGIKVIEFNARFGDPETEVILPLLESDAYDIFHAVATSERLKEEPRWSKQAVLGIVMAANGYPGSYKRGAQIHGLEDVSAPIIQMGTKSTERGLAVNGGRVLMLIAEGETLQMAHQKAYEEIGKIKCDELFYRKDIGHAALDEIGGNHQFENRY